MKVSGVIARQTPKALRCTITIVAVWLLGGYAGTALAQAPANDNFADATLVAGLPFSDSVDNTMATTEAGEPQFCNFLPRTVWYSFTPTVNAVVRADMAGSGFGDTNFNVYQAAGSGIGDLSFLNCVAWGGSFTFAVQAGTTYYLQAGDIYSGGGTLQLNLQAIPPPPNDDFANALPFAALPFSNSVDTTAATQEVGEPVPSCTDGYPFSGTVWYAFTAAASGSVTASISSPQVTLPLLAVYSGNSLASLTPAGCTFVYGDLILTFHANAGTTYFFQVAGLFDLKGPLQFQLNVAPPPVASFFFYPSDPSIFDTVGFYDYSSDPGQAAFQSFTWDFGDGATSTEFWPIHRYAADGDYTVQHTATTVDGRTASTSQVVHMQTHDVAIVKFSVPKAASAQQTRSISIGINSRRYAENVQVDLYKSVPAALGSFELVGSLREFVPVRPSNRTTDFNFTYTFTGADADLGKVTFRAIATILTGRDALPTDNEAISLPTKVSR